MDSHPNAPTACLGRIHIWRQHLPERMRIYSVADYGYPTAAMKCDNLIGEKAYNPMSSITFVVFNTLCIHFYQLQKSPDMSPQIRSCASQILDLIGYLEQLCVVKYPDMKSCRLWHIVEPSFFVACRVLMQEMIDNKAANKKPPPQVRLLLDSCINICGGMMVKGGEKDKTKLSVMISEIEACNH